MKDLIHGSNIEQSEKKSAFSYALSIVLIAMAMVAIASIMSCSLPY